MSECKGGIAMLLQEKSKWSESTFFANIDISTVFGTDCLGHPRHLPYLCVGMLKLRCASCFIASSERGGNRRVVERFANVTRVDWGLKHRFYLSMKNVSISVVIVTCRKLMVLLSCDLCCWPSVDLYSSVLISDIFCYCALHIIMKW